MKKLGKRFLSLFLAIIMSCSAIQPITAQAWVVKDFVNWYSNKIADFVVGEYNSSVMFELEGYYVLLCSENRDGTKGRLLFPKNADIHLDTRLSDGSFSYLKYKIKGDEIGLYKSGFAFGSPTYRGKVIYSGKKVFKNITSLNIQSTQLLNSHSHSIRSWAIDYTSGNYKNIVSNYNDPDNSFYSYWAVPNWSIGRYKVITRDLNIRSGAGTNYSTVSSPLSSGIEIGITKISNEWGYGVTETGVKGWVNLYYCSYVGPNITKPAAPSITLNSSQDIPVGGFIEFSWNKVTDAEYYTAQLYNSAGKCVKTINNIYTNSAFFEVSDADTYTVKVFGQNYMYDGDVATLSKKITAHKPNKVTYLNDDGSVIAIQEVPYGQNATAPIAPEKEGYTFNSWQGSLTNIKADAEITAQYTVNTYKVQFIDANGELIGDEQNVVYGEDATPPSVTEAPENYEFVGWDSEKYKNVYSIDKNEPIKIYAVYNWKNKNLPVDCTNVSASRQPDGYYVYFDLQNYPDAITRGRAVIALKTSTGKLIDMTESAAFSIPKGGTKKQMEVFVPCEKAATTAEVIIVDSYASGIPISNIESSSIEQGLMWSDWDPVIPDDVDLSDSEIEQRQEYRFRDKRTATGNTKTKEGFLYDGTYKENVGVWSAWSWNVVNGFTYEDKKREVQTQQAVKSYNYKTYYNYYYYRYWNTTYKKYFYTYGSGMGGTKYTTKQASPLTHYDTYDGHKGYVKSGGYINYSGELWFESSPYTTSEKTSANYATQYRYRDTLYTYNFYRWDDSDWSDWSDTVVTATDNRQVEERTAYRYKSVSAGIEDNSGEAKTFTGFVDESLAGKNITLFISKYKASSDFTNEYVAQSTIRDDGSYSFTYKLREEPTAETGDFTIYIGIEGETGMREVGVIEAPKAKYTVNFYDVNDNLIETQLVEDGSNAVIPEAPKIEGSTFICWNNSCTNVKSSLDVKPIYTKNTYTVAYVDWRTDTIVLKDYEYGAPLELETFEDCETGYAKDWDVLLNAEEGEEILVTSNMVVEAVYDTKTFKVDFTDAYGNVVDSRTVEYGSSITSEELPKLPKQDGVEYLDWDIDLEDLVNIKTNITVPADFYFDETAPNPVADITTGHYTDSQTVTLTCSDPNAQIYYTLDGTDPSDNIEANLYYKPIEISEDTILSFCAVSLGKNNSDTINEYYAFNDSKIVFVHSLFDYSDDRNDSLAFITDNLSSLNESDFEIEGYTFGGLYADSTYTERVDLSSNSFGNVVDLYAKYTINSYTVTFMNDGEVLKTETVEFEGCATPPEMSNIGTKVFCNWDTEDYLAVTEDLTVNAVYKEESEIVKITLNRENYTMDEGGSFKLLAELSDNAEEDTSIIWHSDDESIAAVLDDGTVSAISSGETIVYAVASDNSAVAECKITVNPSVNYSVCLKDSADLKYDSLGYLRNIPLTGNTVDNVLSQFKNSPATLTVTNAKGNTIAGTELIGTKSTVSLKDGDRILDTVTAVMTGDITCDGLINNRDVVYTAMLLVNLQSADEAQLLAIDVNGDGKVNNRDVALLARYLVGKEIIKYQ